MLGIAEFALAVCVSRPFERTVVRGVDAVFADGVAEGFETGTDVFVVFDEVDAVEVG